MLSLTLLLSVSLVIAAPLSRIFDVGPGNEVASVKTGHILPCSALNILPCDDDDVFVDLVRRGKGQKKKKAEKVTIHVGGGAAPAAYTKRERSKSPERPPKRSPSPAPVPAGHEQHPVASTSHQPATPPPAPANAASTSKLSWAGLARLKIGVATKAKAVAARPPSPARPWTPTSSEKVEEIRNRVNKKLPPHEAGYSARDFTHAFVHNGKDHYIIKNERSGGVDHVNIRHGDQFKNFDNLSMPHAIEKAMTTGRILGPKDNGRPIYEFEHEGGTHHIAVTARDGYIVGAHVPSDEKVKEYHDEEAAAAEAAAHRGRQPTAGGSGSGGK